MGNRTPDGDTQGMLEKRYAAYVKARVRRARQPALPTVSPGTAHADWSALIGHLTVDRIAAELDTLKCEYRALKRYLKALVRDEPHAATVEGSLKPDARRDNTGPDTPKPTAPGKPAAPPRRRVAGAKRIAAKPTGSRTAKPRRRRETEPGE